MFYCVCFIFIVHAAFVRIKLMMMMMIKVRVEFRASPGADVRGQMSYIHTGMDDLLCDVQFYRLVAIFRMSARTIGYTSSGFDVRRQT